MGLKLEAQRSTDSLTSTPESIISTSSSLGSASSTTTGRGSHKCLAILHGNGDDHVISLAMAGDVLYAGSDRGNIRAWEHPDMLEGTKFGCGAAAVKSLAVVGDRVVSAHQDHKMRLWRRSRKQPQLHKLAATLPSLKDYLTNFLPPKNYVQVRRHHKALWINHHDSVSVLAVGNEVLYSGSWDKSIKVWRLTDFKCVESFNEHIDAVNALVADNQNSLFYSGSADATIKVFEKQDKKHLMVATLEGSRSPVNALALSPDGAVLYSGHSDRTIMVWKREDNVELGIKKHMSPVGVLRGHRLSVLCLSTISDLVVSGSADKSVRVWKRNLDGPHTCISVMVGHTGPVKSLCMSMDMAMGAMVYSGSTDGDVRVWWIPEDEKDYVSSDDGSPDSPVLVKWRFSNISLPSL